MIGPKQRLSADHSEIDALLDQAVAALGRQTADEALAVVDLLWARLAVHIRAEHVRLFPIVTDVAPEIAPVIAKLRDDHDLFMTELAKCIRSLRLAVQTSGQDPGLFQSVLERIAVVGERLVAHNATEESAVYPLAEERLAAVPSEDLAIAIASELERMPPRFDR